MCIKWTSESETEMLSSRSGSGWHLSETGLRCHVWCSTGGSLPVSAAAARQHAVRLTNLLLTLHKLHSFCCANETLSKEKFPRNFCAFHHPITPGEKVPLREVLLFVGVHTIQTGANSQILKASSLPLSVLL